MLASDAARLRAAELRERARPAAPAANPPAAGAGIGVSVADETQHPVWLDVIVTGFANPDTQGVPSHETFSREVLDQTTADMAATSGFVRYHGDG